MQPLDDLEVGLMFWANGPAEETLARVKTLGLRCGQLGIPGDYDLTGKVREWRRALDDAEFRIDTVFCSYPGESYADVAAVLDTVGLVPEATREARLARTKEVADFAGELQVGTIACHIGFVPENRALPAYKQISDAVAAICKHSRRYRQSFALETGQEPAKVLLHFIEDVGAKNLKVNFDPANMILYGTGNPIEALHVLAKYVVSVHCKDGDWPPVDQPKALGKETKLGQGSVGIPEFVSKLKEIGYRGPLYIERELDDSIQAEADLREAIQMLRSITQPPALIDQAVPDGEAD